MENPRKVAMGTLGGRTAMGIPKRMDMGTPKRMTMGTPGGRTAIGTPEGG